MYMKIIETRKYVFDDEDRRLLSIDIPDNPCENCSLMKIGGCCGCPDNIEYTKIILPYKERNIFELALKIKRMNKLQKEISNMQKEIDCIAKEIEEIGIFS